MDWSNAAVYVLCLGSSASQNDPRDHTDDVLSAVSHSSCAVILQRHAVPLLSPHSPGDHILTQSRGSQGRSIQQKDAGVSLISPRRAWPRPPLNKVLWVGCFLLSYRPSFPAKGQERIVSSTCWQLRYTRLLHSRFQCAATPRLTMPSFISLLPLRRLSISSPSPDRKGGKALLNVMDDFITWRSFDARVA